MMPTVTAYLNKGDHKLWKLLKNKSQFISEALQSQN